MESQVRFSSCRGVAFEIKPRPDPFAITTPQRDPEMTSYGSKRFWLPWSGGSSSRVAPLSLIQRSMSKASSHFCDLDLDLDGDDDEGNDVVFETLEEGAFLEPEKHAEREQAKVASKIDPRLSKPSRGHESSRLSVILFDQGLFTVYKRLFVVCLTLNVVALVLAATGHFPYARNRAALFSITNIFALTLCRSEAFLRVAFWLAVKLLGHSWVPLLAKTATTSLLQSLGGIHSGCGVSSLAWLFYALVLTLKNRDNTSPEIIGVASVILALIALSCLLWGFVILTTAYDWRTKSYKSDELASRLVRQQEFWFTVGITVCIIVPWVTVRRVPVKVSSPSGHASIIKFHGGVKAGILGRISPSPLSEWHAFGIISDGKDEHMMLAGAVGDFTKSLVANPPTHLWVRQVHFAGLPYLVNMYDRVLLVATGSGICVFLSFLLQPCKASIKEMVSRHPRDKVIVHDTAVHGRPNVAEMSVDTAKKWGAEVVIVTSNPEGSRDVVNACKTKGIAAFGPIWDS
ncbi:adenylate-forming reductase 03009-like [Rhodamnia argentea]|uniref:Adenylate-forming reductase 03009-like n=1 Tax=Rhodamnia argentea TaxID=178133 RepID=A0ABM3HY44_9MYRT|nr:adenylate-forming reductase 03009-like [Rhodamnia argentea]